MMLAQANDAGRNHQWESFWKVSLAQRFFRIAVFRTCIWEYWFIYWCCMTLLGSWRCSTEEHHPRMQSAWAFVLFQHAEESPNTETRWRKMPRGKRGLLLSIVEGALLRQLDHFRYDWLKQVAIILLHSNWPWLVRSWSGLQFSIFKSCLWAADCGGLGLAWYCPYILSPPCREC